MNSTIIYCKGVFIIITVQRLLKELTKYGVRLVAGGEGLNEPVEYINIQEFALKSERIKRNGIILTTLGSFEKPLDIIKHLEWLISRGVKAVGIHSVIIKEVPIEVLDFANAMELPLWLIPEDMPYTHIYDTYNDLLIIDANLIRSEIEKVNTDMLNAVAYDKGSDYVIQLMGQYLKTTVIYLDKGLKINGISISKKSDRTTMIKEVLEIVSRDSEDIRANISNEETIIYTSSIKEMECTTLYFYPIVNNMNFYGYLVVTAESEFTLLEESVIQHGITALLLDSVKQNTMEKYLKNEDIEMVEEILKKTEIGSTKKYNLSSYLKEVNTLYLIDLKNKKSLNQTFNIIYKEMNKWSTESLVWIYDFQIICIVNAGQGDRLINHLNSFLVEYNCGISESGPNIDGWMIKLKYEQAKLCIERGKVSGITLNKWSEIGIEKFVIKYADDQLVAYSAMRLLSPLIEYDQRNNSELLNTLSIYLQTFFSLKKSAEILFIHKNTVKYRIDKIKEIYRGIRLEDHENFLCFSMALKVYGVKLEM